MSGMPSTFVLRGTAPALPTAPVTKRDPTAVSGLPHYAPGTDCTCSACEQRRREASVERHLESEQRRLDESDERRRHDNDDDSAEQTPEGTFTRTTQRHNLTADAVRRIRRIDGWLKRHGWTRKELGGMYQMGIYFSPNGKTCIKLGGNEDGWGRYITWAATQKSVHAPRVSNIVDQRERHGYIAVAMERLYSIRGDAANATPNTSKAARVKLSKCYNAFGNKYKGTLGKFIARLENECNDGCSADDLHGGNVMVRVNASGMPIGVVVTDPIA